MREDCHRRRLHAVRSGGRDLRGREAELSKDAIAHIRGRMWPGNVRELENAIERACILSDSLILEPLDLGLVSASIDDDKSLNDFDLSGTLSDVAHRALTVVERKKISAALAANSGNKSRTAEDLGISYKTLLNKIKEYGL